MEFTSKVKEGGLDHTVSEIVNVVASKTTEIGQRTWGIMKRVMAIASQKVEEFTKEESATWNQQNTRNEGNGYYQNKPANSSLGGLQSSSSGNHNNYRNSNSWDDLEKKTITRKQHQRCRLLMMMMTVGLLGMITMVKMMMVTIKAQPIRGKMGNQTLLGPEVFSSGASR